MPQTLTLRLINSLAAAGRRIELWDSVVRGLVLRVTPAGAKTFSVWYRDRGRARRFTIPGRFPVVGLAAAREQARDVLARARTARDPQEARVDARHARTFAELAKAFITAREADLAPSTLGEYRRMVACYVHDSPLGSVPVASLRRADVASWLESVARRGPVMGNRVHQLVRAVCRWAVREELVASSPCEGLPRPRREHRRERVLTDDEILALWKALDGEAPAARPEPRAVSAAVKTLLLLGQRSSETIEMRRSDLDLLAKTWTIPGRFRKGGRARVVPVSDLARRIIDGAGTSGARVFAGVSEENAERDWWGRVREKAIGLGAEHFTKNDLRRTCAAGCARLGASDFVVSRILGYATPPGIRFTPAPDPRRPLTEVAAALSAWAAHVERICGAGSPKSEVVPSTRVHRSSPWRVTTGAGPQEP